MPSRFPIELGSGDRTPKPNEILHIRSETLSEAVRRIAEAQRVIASSKGKHYKKGQIQLLGTEGVDEQSSDQNKMPSDAAISVAAEQMVNEMRVISDAEQIINAEANRLAQARQAIQEALSGEAD